MSKKQFSIRLEQETYEQLEDYRWHERKSLNDVVSEAVRQFLDKVEKEKQAI